VLRKSGRQRNIESWADHLRTIFTGDYLHQLPLLEQAMGRQTRRSSCNSTPRAAPLTTSPPPRARRSPSTRMRRS
jgi:hypothetical protein